MLELTPVSLKEANAFVAQRHRHHRPVTGHKFSIGCAGMAGGLRWTGTRKPQKDLYPPEMKIRYEKEIEGSTTNR